ncbi:conserved hypothetical protein [Candidatus Desulfosporosinus infrequens]|uniref:Endonuclease GajA/Old nuclease/RecF-like AAA domain-containing protein n=1 Tax=Candidatus Desulfosporosinus infrequens TaxID=2043169 RepID=A0A2U3K6E0_9FIRM|nr:conserved hypothetical protein [Candidatus Desulfosporosinus infrequens]
MEGCDKLIQSLYIDNFKALNDFTIKMQQITVLIGTNGSGKTSILQALDLIINFAQMDIDAYLEKRNWKPYDLKSKTSSKNHVTFTILFDIDIDIDGCEKLIEWTFVLNPVKGKGKIFVISEEIVNKANPKIKLLSVDSQGISRFNFVEDKIESFPPLNMTSSFLKNIDIQKDKAKFPELVAIIEFLTASDSFELLSTEKMRRSSRGDADTIGMGGEKLAAFIHGLKPEQRRKVSERLQNYVPFISDVETEVKGRPGWLEIKLSESFPSEKLPISISSTHVSDGTLRMLAISALQEAGKTAGMDLLDEIENGINPHLAEKMVNDLIEGTKNKRRQIILTTHSTVILDYFPPDSIIFLWRDKQGVVHNQALFSIPNIRERLEYMYPGEIWLNMDENEIVAKLLGEK